MFSNLTLIFRATRQSLAFSPVLRGLIGGLSGLVLLSACSDNYLTDGVVMINTGQESDAWTTEPPAKNLQLEMIQATQRTTLTKVAAPVTNISIGTGGPENQI